MGSETQDDFDLPGSAELIDRVPDSDWAVAAHEVGDMVA
jgi:hypothetical protein